MEDKKEIKQSLTEWRVSIIKNKKFFVVFYIVILFMIIYLITENKKLLRENELLKINDVTITSNLFELSDSLVYLDLRLNGLEHKFDGFSIKCNKEINLTNFEYFEEEGGVFTKAATATCSGNVETCEPDIELREKYKIRIVSHRVKCVESILAKQS